MRYRWRWWGRWCGADIEENFYAHDLAAVRVARHQMRRVGPEGDGGRQLLVCEDEDVDRGHGARSAGAQVVNLAPDRNALDLDVELDGASGVALCVRGGTTWEGGREKEGDRERGLVWGIERAWRITRVSNITFIGSNVLPCEIA